MTMPARPWRRFRRCKKIWLAKKRPRIARSAERVGKAIAEKLLAKKVENVVFDRGGYISTAR